MGQKKKHRTMGYTNGMRYRVLSTVKKHGRSAVMEGRGSVAPFSAKRQELATRAGHVLPGQSEINIPTKIATGGGELRFAKAGKKRGSGSGKRYESNTANTDQTVHNQPRFSGDALAQFRKLARGGS